MTDTTTTAPAVPRVTLLYGHDNAETGYEKDDPPYGRQRCKIRFWVETKPGTKTRARQQRYGQQTTDPKTGNTVWNKPKYSTYSLMVFLYLDHAGQVQHWHVTVYDLIEERNAKVHLSGLYEQMSEEDRARYDYLHKLSRAANPTVAAEWDAKVDKVARYIESTGQDPKPNEHGVWIGPEGRVYLGTGDTPAVIAAWARAQLTQPAA